MNNSFSTSLKKISLPLIIALTGIGLLIAGFQSGQSNMYLIATLLFTVAGLVAMFFSVSNNIGKLSIVIGSVLGTVGVVIYYQITNDIITIEQSRTYDIKMDELVKQNLTDIKTAQITYKEANQSYAKDWNTLKDFIVNGKIKIAVKNGGVPNRRLTTQERAIIYGAGDKRALDYNMTEVEALALSKTSNPPADLREFVRDTMSSSFYESSFGSTSSISRRAKMGFPEFNVDSIFYVPNSGVQFKIAVTDSVEYQGIKVQALYVEGELTMKSGGKKVLYSFGSISSPALSSSWD